MEHDWTAGYVADVGYTHGYYSELNPLRMRLALLHAGVQPPALGMACELGFGQGVSINLHAAASAVHWTGTDFNPAQAGFAQEMAQAAHGANSGGGAEFYDLGFEQFCARTDLPDFDTIGLHGIWSWINDANRAVIVDFVRRKLKVGGVLYISYNTQPGWAAMAPMRDLLAEHARVLGHIGSSSVQRMDSALAFAQQLLATNPLYAKANPQMAQRIEKMAGQNRSYLVHEYLNRDWQPMSFAHMAQWLDSAKLQWACSAHLLDAIPHIHLTQEQQQLLADIPDAMFRQTVRDFCTNQQFRKDYWVKGARPLTPLEQAEALRAQRVVLVQPRAQVPLKVTGSLGEGTLNEETYVPLLDELADHKPKTLAQLEQALQTRGANVAWSALVQAVTVLGGSGALTAAADDASILKAKKRTERLNHWLLHKARSSGDVQYLASPVTGGGIGVSRFAQLFLLARQLGHKTPQDWAGFVWPLLKMQGQRIVKAGTTLETDEAHLAELTHQAQEFSTNDLPMLRALQVA